MFAETTWEEWSAALDATAEEILQAAGVDAPPVNAVQLAAALEMSVAWSDRQPGRASIVRLHDRSGGGEQTSILLRPEPRSERCHWAVAHEVGEAFAHGLFARLGVDPVDAPPDSRERAANALAGRLLLPSAWFLPQARADGWNLMALKARFATASHELIARRMLDFLPAAIVTVLDLGRITWRRSNVPGAIRPLSPAEKAAWRKAHAGRAFVSDDGTLQAWPIHEPDWKREILRTVLPDEWGQAWE